MGEGPNRDGGFHFFPRGGRNPQLGILFKGKKSYTQGLVALKELIRFFEKNFFPHLPPGKGSGRGGKKTFGGFGSKRLKKKFRGKRGGGKNPPQTYDFLKDKNGKLF